MHDQINCKKSPTGSLPPAVPLAITPTFRPWTHTFDDSYMYQLSIVVATATVYLSLLERGRFTVTKELECDLGTERVAVNTESGGGATQ